MSDWRPSASIASLRKRAEFLAQLRRFFADKNVLEVDVPVLSTTTVSDPNIESVQVICNDGNAYLQTSPEYFMKRLLAAGSGDIYYLGKVFRDNERGRKHSPEFTMLEWYREGFTDQDLMEEVSELVLSQVKNVPLRKVSYRDIFLETLAINPHTATAKQIEHLARQHIDCSFESDHKDLWLDVLFTHLIEPNLRHWVFIYDYPESQGALAKKAHNEHGEKVAKRFELYCDGIEMGNGYWELTDAKEQRERFEADLIQRQNIGARALNYDERILAALEHGLPECSGIAMGVDRMLMLKLGVSNIAEVLPFKLDGA